MLSERLEPRDVASLGAERGAHSSFPVPPVGPPFQTLSYEELLAKLRALTNLRVVADAGSVQQSRAWPVSRLGEVPGVVRRFILPREIRELWPRGLNQGPGLPRPEARSSSPISSRERAVRRRSR